MNNKQTALTAEEAAHKALENIEGSNLALWNIPENKESRGEWISAFLQGVKWQDQQTSSLIEENKRLRGLAKTCKSFLFAVSEGLITVFPDSEDVVDFTQLIENDLNHIERKEETNG